MALLWLAVAGALAPAAAQAQSVAVMRIEPAAEPICAQVEGALSGFNVAPDPGYYQEASQRGLDPASEQAMAQLAPLVGVDLVLVPLGADDQGMALAFRDGHTGQSLGEIELPLTSGMLGFVGRQQLQRETRSRLTTLGGGGAQPPPRAGGGPVPPRSATGAGPTQLPPTGAGYRDTGEPEEEPEAGSDETALQLSMHAGAGMGMRSVEWAAPAGRTSVDLGAFPALELGAALWLLPSDGFGLGAQVDYQSSFGHEIDEQHDGGASARPMAIRSHRLDARLVPQLRFGDDHDIRVGFGVGYGMRSLRPAVHHLLTPDFSLGGPTLQLSLHIPLSDEVALVLAPEAQLIVQVSDELEVLGTEGSGVAFGGEGALAIAISKAFSMELTFRESHASLSSRRGDATSDVERFATARLSGVL